MKKIVIIEEMSKADEMELLESIQKSIPVDSYLHSLFSNELLQSFRGSMMNDVSCDIYGDLIKSSQHDLDRVLSAQSETAQIQSHFAYAVKKHDELKENIVKLISEKERLEEERYEMICSANRMKIDFAKCREKNDDLQSEVKDIKSRFWAA